MNAIEAVKIAAAMYLLLGLFVSLCLMQAYLQSTTKKHHIVVLAAALSIMTASWPYWARKLVK